MIENDILRYIVIALLTVGLSFILMKRKAKGGKMGQTSILIGFFLLI